MKITIDTNIDSASDMKDVISLLQNVLKNRGHAIETSIVPSFSSNSNTSDDRLARKLAKIKAKEQAKSEPATTPMNMFGNSETVNAPVETFNMFDSPAPIVSTSANDMLNESSYSSEDKDEDEPKIEIIPF